mmetsp:Transcript_57905/g.152474  ORF Transcript_57905/g.152474 Transcript_57905/m.152474 type:complete len:305 (+) Transcript_57905:326-1240(+)
MQKDRMSRCQPIGRLSLLHSHSEVWPLTVVQEPHARTSVKVGLAAMEVGLLARAAINPDGPVVVRCDLGGAIGGRPWDNRRHAVNAGAPEAHRSRDVEVRARHEEDAARIYGQLSARPGWVHIHVGVHGAHVVVGPDCRKVILADDHRCEPRGKHCPQEEEVPSGPATLTPPFPCPVDVVGHEECKQNQAQVGYQAGVLDAEGQRRADAYEDGAREDEGHADGEEAWHPAPGSIARQESLGSDAGGSAAGDVLEEGLRRKIAGGAIASRSHRDGKRSLGALAPHPARRPWGGVKFAWRAPPRAD